MIKKVIYLLVILIFLSDKIFSQENSFKSSDELIAYYAARGYTLCNPDVNPPIVVAVNYFMEKYPNTKIENVVPLFGDYLYIYINLPPERNIPNIVVAAIYTFNNVEYQFYKINENMETIEERSYMINGKNEHFKVFY